MNPIVAMGAITAFALLAFGIGSGKKKPSRTIAGASQINAKAGTDYALDVAATGVDANQLRRDMYAAVEARGNFILEFEATRENRYRVVIHFAKADTILLNQPVESNGVVITTLSARKLSQ
jgi:hypothetical protein